MTSPFRDIVRMPSADPNPKLQLRKAELDSSLEGNIVNAVYIAFEAPISAEFETQIIYWQNLN